MLDKVRKLDIIASNCTVCSGQTAYRFTFSHADTIRICKWMYKDATIKLERKHQKYLQGKDIPYTHSKWLLSEIELLKQGIAPLGRNKHSYNSKCYALRKQGLL